MLRTDKEASVADIRATFARMSSAVFVDYAGMTVEEISNLRSKFRARGVEYKVFKNTLVKKALAGEKFVDALAKTALRGMTGVALSFEEPSAAARVVKDFVKENEKLKIKGGLMDGAVLSASAVENQLATLPSKDEARAMLLATMNAPAQTFVRLLNAPAQQFALVLEAKRNKG
jgi:large subunit ribosomal protein L10